jgi:phage baseplate assembly protein W
MYQPEYPLKFSEISGPYSSLDQLKDTVKQNVVTLLNVSPGEWPGNPELGVGVRRFLFSNYPSPELSAVHKKIKDQFAKYLPFLEVKSELVDKDEYGQSLVDANEIKLVIRYNITPIAEQDLIILNVGESQETGI